MCKNRTFVLVSAFTRPPSLLAKLGLCCCCACRIRLFSANSSQPWYNFEDLDTTNVGNVHRLPIPDLNATMTKYLSHANAKCDSPEQFQEHVSLVERFIAENGLSLDAKLRKIDAEQESKGAYPFSYIEEAWDDMYLEGRYPNCINVNPSYHLELPTMYENDDRFGNLAEYALSTLNWHQKVIGGHLDDVGDVCLSPFAKQLGAARIPRKGRDVVELHPHSRHIAVFCGSDVFSVTAINDNGEFVSEGALKAAFEQIANNVWSSSTTTHGPLAIFTAGDRDDWASTRDHLVSLGNNKELLRIIDSAALSIAIDAPGAEQPPTATTLSTATFLGNSATGAAAQPRWFDKHQLLSLENGELGYNFEHSYSDGMSWNRMISEVAADVQGYAPPKGCQSLPSRLTHQDAAVPTKLEFMLDDELNAKLSRAQDQVQSTFNNIDNRVVNFTDFGKNEIKTWKHSPDAIVQMAFMMAYADLDGNRQDKGVGRLPAVYEACSVSRFLHGRTETIRSLTKPAANFIRAIQNTTTSISSAQGDLNVLLAMATSAHRTNSMEAALGRGIDRHLYALQLLAAKEQIDEPLFADPLFQDTKRWLLSTSNVTADFIRYFAFGPVDPDGYGLGYMILPDSIPMNISSFKDSADDTNSEQFGAAVQKSLRTLKEIAAP